MRRVSFPAPLWGALCKCDMHSSPQCIHGAQCTITTLFDGPYFISFSAKHERSGLEGRRHEAEQARTAGRGRRRRDGCEALEGCIQTQADRTVSGEWMPRRTPDGRAVAGGAPTRQPHAGSAMTECAGRHSPHTDRQTHATYATHTSHHTPQFIVAICLRWGREFGILRGREKTG